ncbi:MAG: Xaa-Pro peptidase family protein [Betaproteobacteria bacterium]
METFDAPAGATRPPVPAGANSGGTPDIRRMHRYRNERIRAELRKRDYAAGLFCDAINVRYATGSRNMQVWTLRNPARYVFVAAEGPTVMFEFGGCDHLVRGLETIQEIRPTTSWFYFTSGPRMAEHARRWATEIADLVGKHGGGNRRLAVDRVNPEGYAALQALGIALHDGQEVAERARAIKSADEIDCLRSAIAVCEGGLQQVRDALKPGVTENQLLATLNAANIAGGGEYIETRLLTAGPRTNPWFQESSERPIAAGELLAIDTDMIGPYGYFADMSRTFLCGEGRPTAEQKTLYGLAHEQVATNTALLRPGVGFREFMEASWAMPDRYIAHRYMSLVHGAGLCGEYPYIPYPTDFERKGYDGLIEENMTLCVESFIGDEAGGEGVKLEQLVLVTSDGPQPLTTFPFERGLL